MKNVQINRYYIALLLGSYDSETIQELHRLKDHVIQNLMYYDDTILIFLLENVETYSIEFRDENNNEKKFTLICETYQDKITFLIVDANAIVDSEDRTLPPNLSADEFIESFIKSRFQGSIFLKLPIIEKLKQLADASTITLLVRHKELTRGGEYIELAFLLGSSGLQSQKTFFLSNKNIDLSEMVWEILDYYGVNFRPYKSENDLITESMRLIRRSIRQND